MLKREVPQRRRTRDEVSKSEVIGFWLTAVVTIGMNLAANYWFY